MFVDIHCRLNSMEKLHQVHLCFSLLSTGPPWLLHTYLQPPSRSVSDNIPLPMPCLASMIPSLYRPDFRRSSCSHLHLQRQLFLRRHFHSSDKAPCLWVNLISHYMYYNLGMLFTPTPPRLLFIAGCRYLITEIAGT